MKKEMIYIIVPVILCIGGFVYKSMFLSDTLKNTSVLNSTNSDINSKFYRDSLVQVNIEQIRNTFDINKRDKRTYGEVVAEILSFTENMLQKSNIQYKGNDINQEFDEVKDLKNGITSFFINIAFTTDFSNVYKLLTYIEQDKQVINVVNLEMSRENVKSESKSGSTGTGQTEEDEFNLKAVVKVRLKLEFVKFL